jgi:NADPH2:quinone reductase
MAHRAGARVLATASSDERLAALTPLGLDGGINYREHDFVDEVRRLTDGRGADVIVDSVGGANLVRSMSALAYRGRCVSVGDAGRGASEPINVGAMRANNQSVTGYFLGMELFSAPRARAMIERLLDEVARGELRVVVDSVFPLAEAAAAHARVEGRQAIGRVIIVP